MKTLRSNWLKVVFVIAIATLLLGCTPTLDDTLSPPTIREPIYACAEMISYGGADRDSKIYVYVNGAKVTEVNTWMGWGAIRLPSPLAAGDQVSAAQIVNNRISEQTREPVTVINIPSDLLTQERLDAPEVVPPLYECQKVVRVRKVLEGATVTLRNDEGDTWEGMTPYNIIRLGTPELKVPQLYDASQRICEDAPFESDWSATEEVQERPASMPEAMIHEPIVAGNDACRVDDLLPGAVVKIYADDGSGPVEVGGGTALESATIFKIDPPFDTSSEYYAIQALCDLESEPPGGITPDGDVPSPTVQEPLCKGDIYVTICDTVELSTIRVYVDGTQVAQAAGNGGCVTIALGNATVLSDGEQVTAEQIVTGNSSLVSAPVDVEVSGAPAYDPAYWNNPAHQTCNNCYNYGCDIRTDTFAQPGYAHGISPPTTCSGVGNAALADGLIHQPEKQCTGCTHLVALVIATVEGPDEHPDYHWYRLDDNGRWSHKPGDTPATDLDASDNPITNPETADRRYVYHDFVYEQDYILDYRIFCTYYCVDKKFVVIDGFHECDH